MQPLYLLKRRWNATRIGDEVADGPDGLPLPPARLQLKTGHNAESRFFIETGRETAAMLSSLAAQGGRDSGSISALLDFGCGCGRVLRWWPGLTGGEVHGCDVDPELAAWCEANLPGVEARASSLEPPLAYEDATFDLVYAISVFTHLTVELQLAWMAEWRRILRPGGILIFTAHGEPFAQRSLLADEYRDYARGEPVVLFSKLLGDRCAAFHPPEYVRSRLLSGWESVREVPGATELPVEQDLYVARRPG